MAELRKTIVGMTSERFKTQIKAVIAIARCYIE